MTSPAQKEAEVTTQGQAIDMLKTHSNGNIAWLDALSDEQVSSTFSTSMGDFPMAMAITFPEDHLRAHASQLECLTIYGDRESRMVSFLGRMMAA